MGCLLRSDTCQSSNLLDIFFRRDFNTSNKVYLRETLVATVQEPVDSAFAEIDRRAANLSQISIGDSEAFALLMGLIVNMSVSATLIPMFGELAETLPGLFYGSGLFV